MPQVKYEVNTRRRATREILKIEMEKDQDGEAVLEPGQKKIVTVKCTPTKESEKDKWGQH